MSQRSQKFIIFSLCCDHLVSFIHTFPYFSVLPGFAHWTEMPNFTQKVFMRLYCLDMTFSHTTGLLRYQGSQEKWKRLMKVVKAKSKASESKITKVYNFFILLWSFSVLYSHISVFLSFKDIKAKKAALVTRNAKMN